MDSDYVLPREFPTGANICLFCRFPYCLADSRSLGDQRLKFSWRASPSLRVHDSCLWLIIYQMVWYGGIENFPINSLKHLGWIFNTTINRPLLNEALKMRTEIIQGIADGHWIQTDIPHLGAQVRLDYRSRSQPAAGPPIRERLYDPLGSIMRNEAIRLIRSGLEETSDAGEIASLDYLIVTDLSLIMIGPNRRTILGPRDGLNGKNYGAILYLDEDFSTEFPTLRYRSHRHNSASVEDQAYYNPLTIVRYSVRPGHFAVFREDLTHRGPGNMESIDIRYALFLRLEQPPDEEEEDEEEEKQQGATNNHWDSLLAAGNPAANRIRYELESRDPQSENKRGR